MWELEKHGCTLQDIIQEINAGTLDSEGKLSPDAAPKFFIRKEDDVAMLGRENLLLDRLRISRTKIAASGC